MIYNAAKGAAEVANLGRDKHKLRPEVVCRLASLFPHLDLTKVRFERNCEMPQEWYSSGVDGMTCGYIIYFNVGNIQRDHPVLLMHELVHVDQFRRLGEDDGRFAWEYGKGFAQAGSYEANPMEREAYEFARRHYPIPWDCVHPWMVSYGGTGKWQQINQAGWDLEDLAFGDFTGDGKTDVFVADGHKWYISEGGIAPLKEINLSSLRVEDLAFGDFNGDGKTAVFRADGEHW